MSTAAFASPLANTVVYDEDGPQSTTGVQTRTATDVVFRPPSGLTHPTPIGTHATTTQFLASLPAGDPTLYTYIGWLKVAHSDPPLASDLLARLVSGTLNTDADRAAARSAWLVDRRAALLPGFSAAEAAVAAAGGSVLERGDIIPYVAFDADRATANAIVAAGVFEEVSVAELETEALAWPSGYDVRVDTNIDHFESIGADLNQDGVPETRFTGAGVHLAHVDVYGPDTLDHPGFFSAPLFTGRRLLADFSCWAGISTSGCVSGGASSHPVLDLDGNMDGLDWHATHALGVMIGDVRAGQDSALSPTMVEDRSWLAAGATADTYHYRNNNRPRTIRAWLRALEQIVGGSTTYDAVNISIGFEDYDCKGGGLSRAIDALLESGLPVFVSAGNYREDVMFGRPCQISKPADSFGAFAVGASVDGTLSAFSSWGDAAADRTIVSMAAPGEFDYAYHGLDGIPGYSDASVDINADFFRRACGVAAPSGSCADPYHASGTSFASPVVTGAYAVYREFYLENYSRLIDLPGVAYANLLLRSDRNLGPATGYHPGEGAGNLDVLMTDGSDRSGPWRWVGGWSCAKDGVWRKVMDVSAALPASATGIRAVAWYHDAPGRRDFVDLELVRSDGRILTDNSFDVKKRILDSAVAPGMQYELRLRGRDNRGNDPVCGSQSKQVYFAFMYASDPGF